MNCLSRDRFFRGCFSRGYKVLLGSFALWIACVSVAPAAAQADGVIRDFRKARKAYRAWKKQNPEQARTALSQAKAALEQFKDQAVLSTAFSEQNASSVALGLEKLVSNTGAQRSMTCISGGPETTGAHIVLYGWKKLHECTGGSGSLYMRTFGPGLAWWGTESLAIACSGNIKGINVGTTAEAAFGYLGLSVGLLFGQSGVCALATYSFGFGAAAGLTFVDFEEDTWDIIPIKVTP
jgi:hypothetical protein